MITPVRNISFNKIKANKKNQQNNSTNPIQKTNSNAFLPNFMGYLGNRQKVTYEWGVENNLFKLPKVTLEDGVEVQIQPDKSQLECAKKLCNGKNVAFFAPTGLGKTTVAHFAMGKNLLENKRTIYTVPIKALANDKYLEFSKIYGKKNVGVLTGDRKINGNAPIVIMTTEIFDNQVQSMSLNDSLKIGTVVYDEAHYIADEERGMAWEFSMINAAKKGIQLLALTATIGNSEEFTKWLGKIPNSRPAEMVEVPSSDRPVPLTWHLFKRGGDLGPRLVDIMTSEIELKELEDTSYNVVDLIYEVEKEYYERRHEANKYKQGYNNEFLLDSSYKETIAPRLRQILGDDWIKTDFKDENVFKKLKEQFVALSGSDMEQINAIASKSGTRALSDNQKRALEIIFKMEYGYDASYKMTDEDYEFAYQQLKMGIGEGQQNFKYDTTTFKRKLEKEFRSLDKDQLELVTQLLSNPSVKNPKFIHENWIGDNLVDVVETLQKEKMLPAIIFKLAQGGCEQAAESLANNNQDFDEEELTEDQLKELEKEAEKLDLLTEAEKEQVREIIEKYKAQGVYLGTNIQEDMLLRGWGVHHAGRLPQYKKLIEELFNKKLIKVCIATSTLGAGINMPAKTVVMTNTAYKQYDPKTEKYEYKPLTANEFHQMTGRAGRRGIDEIGHVVFANLHTPPNQFRKDEDKDKKGKIDELFLAYNLMKAGADPVRSAFRPQSVMLAKYFESNGDLKGLQTIIKDSLKLYLAKDPQKVEKQMMKKFENFASVLFKLGFISRNHKKEYTLTPKGEILTQCQGMNPLMLAALLYDEKLAKLNAPQLAQIAAHIQGSDEQVETEAFRALVSNKIKLSEFESDKQVVSNEFESAIATFRMTEDKVLKALKEGNVNHSKIKVTDSFSGLVGYMFACLNKENPNSIANFEKIVATEYLADSSDEDANKEYKRKATQGNIYKTITGAIANLKQITRICDFAIAQEDKYPNTHYWINLKSTAQEAIELLDKEPINNDPNYENKSIDN